jgi:hypothetical protein
MTNSQSLSGIIVLKFAINKPQDRMEGVKKEGPVSFLGIQGLVQLLNFLITASAVI